MNAELEARRTAARALVADFRAEQARHRASEALGDSWAYRLALAVESLLEPPGQAGADTNLLHGAVLLSGNYDLTDTQVDTALAALDVAAEYRRYRADLPCDRCDASPQGCCDDHMADLEAADAYDHLAAEIWETRREAGR
jgi:hypothetical protein